MPPARLHRSLSPSGSLAGMEDLELHRRLDAVLQQVGRLEQKVDFLFRHLGLEFVDDRPPPNDVEGLLVAGDVVGAVKLFQRKHGVHLLDAKRAVEEIKAKLGV